MYPCCSEISFKVMFILFCVQVVMATNRIETLDPALIRPGTVTPSAVETHISKMKLIMYFLLQNMSFKVVCDDSLFIVSHDIVTSVWIITF